MPVWRARKGPRFVPADQVVELVEEHTRGLPTLDPDEPCELVRSWTVDRSWPDGTLRVRAAVRRRTIAGAAVAEADAETTAAASATAAEVPVAPALDAPGGGADASDAVDPAADEGRAYEQLVGYQEKLEKAGWTVEPVFDGWRTVALDVLVPVSEPRRSRRARRDAAAETAPADAAAGSVQDGAADSEVEAVADEAATAAS